MTHALLSNWLKKDILTGLIQWWQYFIFGSNIPVMNPDEIIHFYALAAVMMILWQVVIIIDMCFVDT